MSDKAKKTLQGGIRDAELSDLELDTVAGGACSESCMSGCSMCCESGSANRGGGDSEVLEQSP